MRVFLAAGSLLLLTACGNAYEAAPPDKPARNASAVSADAEPARTVQISETDQKRICRTVIADMNGHPPRIVEVVSSAGGIVRVRYTRPSDGRVWTNECRIEGGRILWRTVDAFGPGSGLGRWRTDPRDEVFTYSIAGDRVSITTTFPGEPPSTETYTVR